MPNLVNTDFFQRFPTGEMGGDINQILIYNKIVSNDEINLITAILGNRWG